MADVWLRDRLPGTGVVVRDGRAHMPAGGDVFLVAVQLARTPMVLSDPRQSDNPLVFCNAAFCEQTGYPEEEVIGRNCRFLQGPATDPDTVRDMREAVRAREPFTGDLYNYRKDGRGFWNALHIRPVFDASGELLYFFGSQADVTRRKEAVLQRLQRLDAVGAMASGVAHEFNNLMTVVVSSVERATAAVVDERQRAQLHRADQAARRAGRLTQQMLSFAQRQHLDARPVDVAALVRDLDSILPRVAGEGVRVELDLPRDPAPATLDRGQFEGALIALVRNAAEAMPDGGRVRVGVREYRSWDAAEGQTGRFWVELHVADEGEGMPPEVARRATEPFFTTKATGTGLGLPMVHGFAEQSGGRLVIETTPGRGTTVRVVLPRLEGDAHARTDAAPRAG